MKKSSKFITVLVLVLFLQVVNIAHAQFIQTISNFNKYNSLNINEQLYIQTTSEVYAPGDTIWFKVYVRNKASLKKSSLSKMLFVLLIDDQGNIIEHEKTLITDSYSNGFLTTSNTVKKQDYWLVGYSSWMTNFNESEVFKKKIRIEKEFHEEYGYTIMYNQDDFQAGDTLKAIVTYSDSEKKTNKNTQFRYKLLGDDKTIENGTANTVETENRPISFVLHDSIADKFVLRVWDKNLSTDFKVPFYPQILVQFFPEGGNSLVNEIGTIAFKAELGSGIPVEISGVIVDELGQEYVNVKTDYLGMGKFIFAPQIDKKYYLVITEPKGHSKKYLIPAAKENTWAIKAQAAKNNIYVEIKNNVQQFDTCLLTLSIRGYSFYFKLITSGTQTEFTIPTESLPAGIGVLTLLNKKNLPLSERLVFVNHNRFVESGISSDQNQYFERDLVKIKINLKNDKINFSAGDYSLSVYDARSGDSELVDEPNIISSNYLSPEINGVIFNPNHYFESKSKLVEYHLDLLLLTQGWRNYTYLKNIATTDSIKIPTNQEIVSGTLLKKKFSGAKIPAEGKLLVYFSGESNKIEVKKDGRFSFYPEYTASNTSSILLSATSKINSEEILIKLDNNGFQDKIQKNLVLFNDSNLFRKTKTFSMPNTAIIGNSIFSDDNIWIDEVKIKSKKTLNYEEAEVERMKEFFMSAKSPSPDLLKSSIDIKDVVNGMGFYCHDEDDILYVLQQGKEKKVKFIVDGMDKGYSYSNINTLYKPDILKKFLVITGWDAAQYEDFESKGEIVVLFMQTDKEAYKKSLELTDNTPNSISIDGIQVIKEFYCPTYKTQIEKDNPLPDLRKTIYWNPNVVVDSTGFAEVSFYNSDNSTKVKCVLEGITESGIPVHCETNYIISKK